MILRLTVLNIRFVLEVPQYLLSRQVGALFTKMLGGRAKSAAKPKAAQPQQEASVTESTKPAAPRKAEADAVKALMRSAEAALGKGPLSPANPVPGWRAECT